MLFTKNRGAVAAGKRIEQEVDDPPGLPVIPRLSSFRF
jgi:hypothetical protein